MTAPARRPKRIAKSATPPRRATAGAGPYRYFNRELSYLAFNRRVLEQAESAVNPLLERVKFLAIVSSNLDEFYEIRVAGMQQLQDSAGAEMSIDGLTPKEQLRKIREMAEGIVGDQYRCWHEQLVPALAAEGIEFMAPAALNDAQRRWVEDYFEKQVLPVLTPLAIDSAHPFPQLGNKTLNVLLALEPPEAAEGERLYAVLPVPRSLPRLIPLEEEAGSGQRYLFLSDMLKLCAGTLFPGYAIRAAHAFRVTRNSDLYIDEEEAENLLKKIEEELRNLRRGAAVRLEIEEGVDTAMVEILCGHLALPAESVCRIGGPLNLMRLTALYDHTDRPDLKFSPFAPVEPGPLVGRTSLFDLLRERDVLLHHPYESFLPVVEFVEAAAADPAVLAIKQTFYRTSGDSPFVRALIEAARNGKQVTALVELKARFDEANNIKWARELEEAGVHVVFGMLGYKTHCKCTLVVRSEPAGLRRYVHLGSGNYNPRTARQYTDLSLLSARGDLAAEVAQLFNALTGFGRTTEFRQLMVAPFHLHARIQELIAAETANAAAGRPARIIAKMNKLVDPETIENLYAASRAGVRIDLIVRATCCLVPGLPGQSENIRVRNLVGRYLEHARIFHFENGGDPLIYVGSADWMPRNFFRRVETLFPILDPDLRRRVSHGILPAELRDNVDARELGTDGVYRPVVRADVEADFCAQSHFMLQALAELEAANDAAAS